MPMGRPAENWFIYPSDIADVCDLDERDVHSFVRDGQLISEDVGSLLTFTALHLLPKWRQKLQVDTTVGNLLNSTSLPKRKVSPSTRGIPEGQPAVRWTISTPTIMDAIGVSMNMIHLAKSNGTLDPGNLLSLLRFALFKARPKERAGIVAALFARPADKPLSPPKTKQDVRREAEKRTKKKGK